MWCTEIGYGDTGCRAFRPKFPPPTVPSLSLAPQVTSKFSWFFFFSFFSVCFCNVLFVSYIPTVVAHCYAGCFSFSVAVFSCFSFSDQSYSPCGDFLFVPFVLQLFDEITGPNYLCAGPEDPRISFNTEKQLVFSTFSYLPNKVRSKEPQVFPPSIPFPSLIHFSLSRNAQLSSLTLFSTLILTLTLTLLPHSPRPSLSHSPNQSNHAAPNQMQLRQSRGTKCTERVAERS